MPFDLDDEEIRKKLLKHQIAQIAVLIGTGIFVLIVHVLSPTFFQHPNLKWSTSLSDLGHFWPLLVYGSVMAILSSLSITDNRNGTQKFFLAATTSVLAGIWEEVGFRWLFICTAMVGLAVSNWIMGTFAGTIIGAIGLLLGLLVFTVSIAKKNVVASLGGLVIAFSGAAAVYMIWWLGIKDPVYWMYGNIVVPTANFFTLGFFSGVIKNPALPPLFVFGMIAANAKFRDGHKYQGPLGVFNAWIIGFIMMHAVIMYGIGTAIVLHAVYDLEFDVVRYIKRRIAGGLNAGKAKRRLVSSIQSQD